VRKGQPEDGARDNEENVMYISYQLLTAIENDRLRSLEGHRLRREVARGRTARRGRGPRRAVIRVFRPRPATGQAL
jgi:hypothetical protein